MNNFIPPLLEAVLIDYQNNIPDARDPEVLSLMCVIINRFKVPTYGLPGCSLASC
jgi:exportin-1